MKAGLIAATALMGLAACDRGDDVPFNPNAVEESVAALVENWAAAGEGDDYDALARYYADEKGFAWIELGEVRYTDHEAIVAGLEAARGMHLKVDNEVGAVAVTPLSPDAAAFHAAIGMHIASDAFTYAFDGVLSGVAIKRDGEWKFLQGAFSEKPKAE
ncbi:MAG: nuclear transport factor 2 family protein [Pseudomonadota bacterium]|nr:nuclear transport factor 2 family protein [Pseudomonadota bacterium]